MFIIKASYRKETRRFTLPQSQFPTYDQLFSQLTRVLPPGEYYLCKLLLTPSNGAPQLVANEIRAEDQYKALTAPFAAQQWHHAKLRFNVVDKKHHKANKMTASSSRTPSQKTQSTASTTTEAMHSHSSITPTLPRTNLPPVAQVAASAGCCSAHNGKREIQSLMTKFLSDFATIMASNFQEMDVDPQPEMASAVPQTARSHPSLSVICNHCTKPIVGAWRKCVACPDYDLCTSCVNDKNAQTMHTANCGNEHVFAAGQAGSVVAATSLPTHVGVTCDLCEKTIVGIRHKCLDCTNYDLCDNCVSTAENTHPLHEFVKISEPGRIVVHTVGGRARKPVHNATCDLCDSTIRGDRFKCTNCPDYDVCERCFVIAPTQHPTHIFAKIREPGDIMAGRTPNDNVSHSASCNACGKMIRGVRYKCMHQTCPDFDLCMNCEAMPIPMHPENHPLWKMKSNTITSTSMLLERSNQVSASVRAAEVPNLQDIPESSKVSPMMATERDAVMATTVPFAPALPEVSTSPVTGSDPLMDSHAELISLHLPQPLKATFLSDNNMEDGAVIAAGAEFVKSWRMRNDGAAAWPETTQLAFVAGDRLAATAGAPNAFEVGSVAPGAEADVWAADMKAPDEPGRYISHWSLEDPTSGRFGQNLWIDIVVPELDRDSSSHSGSVVLPSPAHKSPNASVQTGIPGVAATVTSSLPTDPMTLADSVHSQVHTPSSPISDPSLGSEAWEDTGSVAEILGNAATSQQRYAQGLEYVVLYDSDEESAAKN